MEANSEIMSEVEVIEISEVGLVLDEVLTEGVEDDFRTEIGLVMGFGSVSFLFQGEMYGLSLGGGAEILEFVVREDSEEE